MGIIKLEVELVILKAKDLSPGQKIAIESPDWLRQSWESAKRFGLDQLPMEEIDAEIDSLRKARAGRLTAPGH